MKLCLLLLTAIVYVQSKKTPPPRGKATTAPPRGKTTAPKRGDTKPPARKDTTTRAARKATTTPPPRQRATTTRPTTTTCAHGGRRGLFQCKKGCKVVRNKGCPHCDCSKQDAKTTPPRRFRATKLFKPPQKPAGKTTKKSDDKKKTTKKPAAKTTKNIGWKVNMQDNQEQVAVNTDVIFTWTGTHDVYLLPNKKAFEECDFSKAKELASTSVNKYTYKASAAGNFYFACKVTGHCKFTKQKLALTVTPAAGKGKAEAKKTTPKKAGGKTTNKENYSEYYVDNSSSGKTR